MNRMLVWAICALSVLAAPAANAQVVISQVYGGGGNSGATLTNDFIELFNRGTSTVSLAGWSVQYASAAGTSWAVTPLSGSIAPGAYYLVQQAKGSGGTVALPTPDAIGTTAMSATAGKVALAESTAALTGACPSAVRDFVGFGSTATCFEGAGPTVTLTNTTAALRASGGCVDTNDNSADFASGIASPRNSASPLNSCGAPVSTSPSASGSASPASLLPGASTLLTVIVTPGMNPDSTLLTVTGDLSAMGGGSSEPFAGAGNTFTLSAVIPTATSPGAKSIAVTVSDAQGRSGSGSIAVNVEDPSAFADHVVISQVYGGGGNSGAPYNRDFVELHNPTDATVDLDGWTLQYGSAGGTSWTNFQPLAGPIGPGDYYLVALASGSTGAALPEANVNGSINMAGASGKIALVRNADLLAGGCPLSDGDLVDFVGYGSANCFEGAAAAPTMSNTTADFRKNGGASDSNNNANDFFLSAPNPRRTAPILDLGPSVLATDPRQAAADAPRDASVTITFSEPVVADGAWYSIDCASTGLHNDATLAASGRSLVITPNAGFQPGEQCTVVLFAARIRDEDLDDSRPNTDALAADYTLTFTIATGSLPPYPADVHLLMGNPSGARADLELPDNLLMEKPEFALSYNRERGTPNWVSWHLSDDWVGTLSRVDTFRPDPAVSPEWYRVQAFDYSGSGFDRGHMVPSADRDKETSIPINQATFLMTNMLPQAPDNNQGPWAALENYLRALLPANEAYVIAGGAGTGGMGSNGFSTTIADGHVTVPAHTWKVALVLPKLDGNDVAGVSGAARTIAVILPNAQGIRATEWTSYLTTVDQVEALTGYDFFSNVSDAVENAIEAGVNGANPPGAADQTVGATEDVAKTFSLDAVSPSGAPLAHTILSAPVHGTLEGSGIAMTYTPAPDFNGGDTFTWRVDDGTASSNVATATIVVMEANDAPVAVADARSTGEATPLVFAAADLTLNDSAGPANESAQTLTVTGVTQTPQTHGSVSLSGTEVIYVPEAGFAGAASFEYRVCDDGVSAGQQDPLCATGTVGVTVIDTTAPQISPLALSRTSLWPVDHKMIDVLVSYSAIDSADPAPVCSLTVSSNEPVDGTGDGDTAPDWEVVDAHRVRLRAERSGMGSGRVYTIAAACRDASGNLAQRLASVTVSR